MAHRTHPNMANKNKSAHVVTPTKPTPRRSNSHSNRNRGRVGVNYRLFLGIVIALFLGWAHWKQRMELLALKSSSSALSSSLPVPSVVPSSYHRYNNHPPPQSEEESPMTQCTCPINPATPMTDDKYNDAKYLLDEMKEQESKWKIQLSEKTSQIDILKRDNGYMQRKFHDLQTKYDTDMKRNQHQMNDLQHKFDDLLKAYATELSQSRDRMEDAAAAVAAAAAAVAAQSGSTGTSTSTSTTGDIPTITNIEGLKQAIAETNQYYNRQYALERHEEEMKRVGRS